MGIARAVQETFLSGDAIYFWIVLVGMVVGLVLVLTWPKAPGKRLFACFLILMITDSVGWRGFLLLQRTDMLDWHSPVAAILLAILRLTHLAANILLLLYVAWWGMMLDKLRAPSEKNARLLQPERRCSLQRRGWTYLLDIAICSILGVVITLPIALIIFALSGGDHDAMNIIGSLGMAIGTAVSMLYFFFKDAFGGKSLGKALTGVRVVDASTGMPIGAARSVARNWIFLIPVMPLVELIVAGCRADKRRLGDLMANTIVVRD